jgi:hypothetical protein
MNIHTLGHLDLIQYLMIFIIGLEVTTYTARKVLKSWTFRVSCVDDIFYIDGIYWYQWVDYKLESTAGSMKY